MDRDRGIAIRALRGLRTQEEFASEYGVVPLTVLRWEQGWPISIRNARRLVDAGLDPSYVMPKAVGPSGTGDGPSVAA